jgi:hypothetical protein
MLEFMVESVKKFRPEPEDIIPIAFQLLGAHLGTAFNPPIFSGPFALPDFRCLPPSVHSALTNIIAETLQHHASKEKFLDQSPAWVQGTILILLSPAQLPLPEVPLRVLRNYLSDKPGASAGKHLCPELATSLLPYLSKNPCFIPLAQHFIAASTAKISAEENMTPCVEGMLSIYHALFVKECGLEYTHRGAPDTWSLPLLLASNPSVFKTESARKLLDDLWYFVQSFVDWENRFESSPTKPKLFKSISGEKDTFALLAVFGNHDDYPGRWASAAELLIQTGTTWANSLRFWLSLASNEPHTRLKLLDGKGSMDMLISGHEQGCTPFDMHRCSIINSCR